MNNTGNTLKVVNGRLVIDQANVQGGLTFKSGSSIESYGNSYIGSIDDSSVSGSTTMIAEPRYDDIYEGNLNKEVKVQITNTCSPNQFKFSDDGGRTWTDSHCVSTSGCSIADFKLTFSSLSGANLDDIWCFSTCIDKYPLRVYNPRNNVGLRVGSDGSVHIRSDRYPVDLRRYSGALVIGVPKNNCVSMGISGNEIQTRKTCHWCDAMYPTDLDINQSGGKVRAQCIHINNTENPLTDSTGCPTNWQSPSLQIGCDNKNLMLYECGIQARKSCTDPATQGETCILHLNEFGGTVIIANNADCGPGGSTALNEGRLTIQGNLGSNPTTRTVSRLRMWGDGDCVDIGVTGGNDFYIVNCNSAQAGDYTCFSMWNTNYTTLTMCDDSANQRSCLCMIDTGVAIMGCDADSCGYLYARATGTGVHTTGAANVSIASYDANTYVCANDFVSLRSSTSCFEILSLPNRVTNNFVTLNASGYLGFRTGSSSCLYKCCIEDICTQITTSCLYCLRPVSFCYKDRYTDGVYGLRTGFIAEEVNSHLPHAVGCIEGACKPDFVEYNDLIPIIVEEMKCLSDRITALENPT